MVTLKSSISAWKYRAGGRQTGSISYGCGPVVKSSARSVSIPTLALRVGLDRLVLLLPAAAWMDTHVLMAGIPASMGVWLDRLAPR